MRSAPPARIIVLCVSLSISSRSPQGKDTGFHVSAALSTERDAHQAPSLFRGYRRVCGPEKRAQTGEASR